MQSRTFLVAGVVALGIGVVGLIVLGLMAAYGAGIGIPPGTTPEARGARILRTGRDAQGRLLSFSGGMMMAPACAQCHGLDGHGRRTALFVSPDITYRNLTDPAGLAEPNGERGPVYTDALIRRAVTEGVDAEGKPLDWPMPRWRLTDADWNDLLAYLKTLR